MPWSLPTMPVCNSGSPTGKEQGTDAINLCFPGRQTEPSSEMPSSPHIFRRRIMEYVHGGETCLEGGGGPSTFKAWTFLQGPWTSCLGLANIPSSWPQAPYVTTQQLAVFKQSTAAAEQSPQWETLISQMSHRPMMTDRLSWLRTSSPDTVPPMGSEG